MLGRLRHTAKKIDMFNTAQFLRYKEETEYGTITGACLSLGIIVVIVLLVFQVLVHTINKDDVTWSMTTTNEVTPSVLNMNMGEMKFGINMVGVKQDSVSYFDVVARSYLLKRGFF